MSDLEALARRAVACRGWRWLPGMKLTAGLRISESLVPFTYPVDLPDFDDPATLGCLLALVREAWSRPELAALRYPASPDADGGWFILAHSIARSNYDLWITNCPAHTEAEALVAALEAAP
jgi:hypothetical protein